MTTDRRMPDTYDLESWWDLLLALLTAASLQVSIRHADAKAAVLLGVQGGLAAAVVESAPSLMHVPGPVGVATALMATAFLCGSLATIWHVGLVLAPPRLFRPYCHNCRAFPDVVASGDRPRSADTRRPRDEAWGLVSTLDGIAMAKHRRLRRGLLGLTVAALSTLGQQILAAFVPPVA